MTQYNTLNVKFGIKNGTKVILKISLNIVGNSNDENNFRHKLLLTNTQVSKLRKALQTVHQLIQNYQKLKCIK